MEPVTGSSSAARFARNNTGGPSEGEVREAVGTGPGDSRLATLTGVTAFDLPNGDDVTLSCWKLGGERRQPVAQIADITAVRVQVCHRVALG